MESISQGLQSNDLLLSQMQSNAAVKKATASEHDASGGVGSALNSFGGILKQQMSTINQLQTDANQAQQTYALGGEIELHNVVMATEKADLALQLAMQVRNKLIAAYQEVSHMTV